jgi:putative hydrolase of the HAD superfamily
MIRGLIFDFYGTLIEGDVMNPSPCDYLTLRGYKSSKQIQLQWESDAFDGQITPSLRDNPNYHEWLLNNYKELARLSGVPNQSIDTVAKDLLLNDRSWTFKAKRYAYEVIDLSIKKGLIIGVCSNWDYPLEEYLVQTGLSCIKNISVSCEVGARKPHPLIFNDILAKIGLSVQEVMFIGDTWNADIIGSRNLGLQAIYLKDVAMQEKSDTDGILHMRTLDDLYTYIEMNL